MSTDKLNRITAIASRQPALNPARYHVSPAVLEFRLLQMTQERDQLAGRVAELELTLRVVRSRLVAMIQAQECSADSQ